MQNILKYIFLSFLLSITTLTYWYSNDELNSANYLAQNKIINDHSSNPSSYRLDDKILRQEVAVLMLWITDIDSSTFCNNFFKDISVVSPNDWACYSIEPLYTNWLISQNLYFRPIDNITKIEALGMIVKASFWDDYEYKKNISSSWQDQVMSFAVNKWITKKFNDYNTYATRGFVFELSYNWMKLLEQEEEIEAEEEENTIVYTDVCKEFWICESDYESEYNTWNDLLDKILENWGFLWWIIWPSVNEKSLEISLNTNSPRDWSIPSSWVILFWKFNFTASWEDIVLNSIKIKRWGLWNRSDIRRVYFEKNWIRLTNRNSISIDWSVELLFQPALTIKAWNTEVLDLKAELSDNVTIWSEHRFYISSASDVNASTTIKWNFPVSTNTLWQTPYSTSNIDVNQRTIEWTYVWKQNNVLFSEITISTTSNSEKNYILNSIRFRHIWTAKAETNLVNMKLLRNWKNISYSVYKNWRDFTIDVYDEIKAWTQVKYELRADIDRWDSYEENYEFEIRNATDISIYEEDTNFLPQINLFSN